MHRPATRRAGPWSGTRRDHPHRVVHPALAEQLRIPASTIGKPVLAAFRRRWRPPWSSAFMSRTRPMSSHADLAVWWTRRRRSRAGERGRGARALGARAASLREERRGWITPRLRYGDICDVRSAPGSSRWSSYSSRSRSRNFEPPPSSVLAGFRHPLGRIPQRLVQHLLHVLLLSALTSRVVRGADGASHPCSRQALLYGVNTLRDLPTVLDRPVPRRTAGRSRSPHRVGKCVDTAWSRCGRRG